MSVPGLVALALSQATDAELRRELVQRHSGCPIVARFLLFAAERLQITVEALQGESQCESVTAPRMVAMAAMRGCLEIPYREVSAAFARKSHGSVIYAVRLVDSRPDLGAMKAELERAWQVIDKSYP